MKVSDFEVGSIYQLKFESWEAPCGGTVPGETLVRKVLEPVDETNSRFEDGPAPPHVIAEWKNFLRVQDPTSGNVHLLSLAKVLSAEIVDS